VTDFLALEKLYDDVVARFAAEGEYTGVNVVAQPFGWRFPSEQYDGINRIVWVPGDPQGNVGVVKAPKYPGQLPRRPLATLLERFYVTVSSYDPTDYENERKQYAATRLLRDAWHRACYLAAHGTWRIESEAWVTIRNERRLGTALRIVCTIEAMVPDAAVAQMPTEAARAVIEQSELSTTETNTVLGDDPP
jgi:hypothetical protein